MVSNRKENEGQDVHRTENDSSEESWPEKYWIDAHCHLADPRIASALDDILKRSKKVGVHAWVQGGVDPQDWQRQLILKEKYGKGFLIVLGLHPMWVARSLESEINPALELLKQLGSKAEAIGELGLDYRPEFSGKSQVELQNRIFEEQLKIASKLGKPIILHHVRSHPDALQILKSQMPFRNGGIVHSFSGSWEIAQQYLELGLSLSVSGVITRGGYEKLKRAVLKIPQESLLIETDSPDQMPQIDGIGLDQLNEPAYLVKIAEVIAQIRGIKTEELLFQNTLNLKKIFGKALE